MPGCQCNAAGCARVDVSVISLSCKLGVEAVATGWSQVHWIGILCSNAESVRSLTCGSRIYISVIEIAYTVTVEDLIPSALDVEKLMIVVGEKTLSTTDVGTNSSVVLSIRP
jgi:hypothetical protein